MKLKTQNSSQILIIKINLNKTRLDVFIISCRVNLAPIYINKNF